MNLRIMHEPLTFVLIVTLGLSGIFMSSHDADAGPADPPSTNRSTYDAYRPEETGERITPSGLDNTPTGGTVPGGTVPGGTVPGGTVPGGTIPGGTFPGGTVPGGTVPGGTLPGGTVPGGTVPSRQLPGEEDG
jgi:hypothetical protein